jgi:acetyl-CoA acetyltransferase
MARQFNARLVLDNDAHAPCDFVDGKMATNIARGAGLTDEEIAAMFANSQKLAQRACE